MFVFQKKLGIWKFVYNFGKYSEISKIVNIPKILFIFKICSLFPKKKNEILFALLKKLVRISKIVHIFENVCIFKNVDNLKNICILKKIHFPIFFFMFLKQKNHYGSRLATIAGRYCTNGPAQSWCPLYIGHLLNALRIIQEVHIISNFDIRYSLHPNIQA